MSNEKKIKTGSLIKGYYIFPVIIGIIFLALVVALAFVDKTAAYYSGYFFVAYIIALVVFLLVNKRKMRESLIQFGRDYGYLQEEFIRDFPIPYAVCAADGQILLNNDKFSQVSDAGQESENICGIFSDISPKDLEFNETVKTLAVIYKGRHYRVQIKKISLDTQKIKNRIIALPKEETFVLAVFLLDETEIVNMVRKGFEQQMVVGVLYIDNFDETLDQIPDVKQSLLIALCDRAISSYFQTACGIVKKLEKDKYFIVFKRKYLAVLQHNKFSLLDEIKKIDAGNEFPVTISMGIGACDDYDKSYIYARQGIELALGRGGDQVVVKDGERVYFYGGKTKQVKKNTRVKARVKTLALKEVLFNKKRVIIMGHKSPDTDSLGAAVGIYRAARYLGRPAHIVLNEITPTIKPVIDNLRTEPEYEKGVFITSQEADNLIDDNTALVIVDVNRPSIFEHTKLINRTKSIILIDHHLQTGERIEYLSLSYIEPTASSTSEMVCEIIQYMGEDFKISKQEAEALYAGILIDTNYFSKNTGVRTFEAAAFLRKCGVDVAKVKGLFNDSFEDFKAKAETIKTAELICPGFVLAQCPSEGLVNPTVVAAQVANEMLDINDIQGSFVITEVNGKIFISARSSGNVNVQLVMEKMGGGGHLNIAGAQLTGISAADAKNVIRNTVRKMKDEGAI